jgi:hypothetical protein
MSYSREDGRNTRNILGAAAEDMNWLLRRLHEQAPGERTDEMQAASDLQGNP